MSVQPLECQKPNPPLFGNPDRRGGRTVSIAPASFDLAEHDETITGHHEVELTGRRTPVPIEHFIPQPLVVRRRELLSPPPPSNVGTVDAVLAAPRGPIR